MIEVGEVKSDLDYSDAMRQLGLRLGALRHLLVLLGFPKDKITLIGRIFVPAHAVRSVVNSHWLKLAHDKWGYELILHPIPSE